MIYIIQFEKDSRIVGYKRIASIAVGPGPQDRINKEANAERWVSKKPTDRKWMAGKGDADIKLNNDGKIKKLTQAEKDALNPPPDPAPIELLTPRVKALEDIDAITKINDLQERLNMLEGLVGTLEERIEALETP